MRALVGVFALAAGLAGQTQVDLKNQGKNIDFTTATSTKPFRTGTGLPAVCSTCEVFFKTDAQPGRNWFACTAENTWTLESGGLPEATGNTGRVLASDGADAVWTALGGDLSGTPGAATVGSVRGRRVADAAPAEGQVLRWNAAASQWEPQSAGLPGAANVSYAFTGQTSVVIPGATHALGTANLIVDCYDGASPNQRIQPSSLTVDPATYDVSVGFAAAQSGRCVINGSGGAGGVAPLSNNTFAGGTTQTFLGALVAAGSERTAPAKTGTTPPPTCGAGDQFFKTDAPAGQNLYFCTAANTWTQMRGGGEVVAVFGRSGTVSAQAGDYSFSQIGGSVPDAQIAAGIDASKIGAGGVTNTAFGYLAGVTSPIQAQLDAKAAASHGHSAGGDVSGDIGAATVTGLQGRAVASTTPSDGQGLVWSAGGNMWQPGTVSGASIGMASQLGDLRTSRTSSTVLTVGGSCSSATPCNARFGNVAYSFIRSCTATVGAGSGTAYVYVASGGVLTIGHNFSVAASAGCMAQPSVTQFPADSIPLFIWTATNGTWDAAGGRDVRAWLSSKGITAGAGITVVESGGRATVGVDTALVPTYLTAAATLNFPAIAAGSCSADSTFTLMGALPGDAVAPGWPGAVEAGLIGIMRASAANTVAVRLCNFNAATVDPVSASYRATVVRGF